MGRTVQRIVKMGRILLITSWLAIFHAHQKLDCQPHFGTGRPNVAVRVHYNQRTCNEFDNCQILVFENAGTQ